MAKNFSFTLRTTENKIHQYEILFGNKIICLSQSFINGEISIISGSKRINLLDSDSTYLNHFLNCKLRMKIYDITTSDKRNIQVAKNHIKKVLSLIS